MTTPEFNRVPCNPLTSVCLCADLYPTTTKTNTEDLQNKLTKLRPLLKNTPLTSRHRRSTNLKINFLGLI